MCDFQILCSFYYILLSYSYLCIIHYTVYNQLSGWSRVLYSTAVQLPGWVPEFVITFLTKTALVEVSRILKLFVCMCGTFLYVLCCLLMYYCQGM